MHFLNRIKHTKRTNVVAKEIFVVIIDVKSLYTNIPHEEGMSAVEKFLSVLPSSLEDTEYILSLLLLSCNNFIFDNTHYLQFHGSAIRSKTSPKCANLFMHFFIMWYYAKHWPCIFVILAIYLSYEKTRKKLPLCY